MEQILPPSRGAELSPCVRSPLAPNFNVGDNTQSMNTEHIKHTWTLCRLQPRSNIDIGGRGGHCRHACKWQCIFHLRYPRPLRLYALNALFVCTICIRPPMGGAQSESNPTTKESLLPRSNQELGGIWGDGPTTRLLESGNLFSIYGPHDHCACTLQTRSLSVPSVSRISRGESKITQISRREYTPALT